MVSNADCARGAMDLMCRHGGNTSFKRESRLAECWRDLHTVGQTVTLAPDGTRSATPGNGPRPANALTATPRSGRPPSGSAASNGG